LTIKRGVSAADRACVPQLIGARTWIAQSDAQRRFDDGVTQLRGRKQGAEGRCNCFDYGGALSKFIGAFIA
jgi:hypothetical protein